MRLADPRRGDVAAWSASLSGELAPATVTRCLVTLKKVLTDAPIEGLIVTSAAATVKPPRQDRVERRFLTVDELTRLETVMAPRWALAVPFAATTGLRIGELSALRVSDLNLAIGEVTVRSTAVSVSRDLSGGETRRQIHPTKTFAGERTVPTITLALRRRLAALIDERGLGPNGWRPGAKTAASPSGRGGVGPGIRDQQGARCSREVPICAVPVMAVAVAVVLARSSASDRVQPVATATLAAECGCVCPGVLGAPVLYLHGCSVPAADPNCGLPKTFMSDTIEDSEADPVHTGIPQAPSRQEVRLPRDRHDHCHHHHRSGHGRDHAQLGR